MVSVAVAVKGGGNGGRGSRRAVKWTAENLKADHVIFIHVFPTLTCIPTPSGKQIPIKQMDSNVVAMYVEDMKSRLEEIFLPFKKLCKGKNIATVLLEGDNPATSLVKFISDSGITSLVLGSCSCSSNCITRKLRGPEVPSIVVKHASVNCNVYVVSKNRISLKSAISLPGGGKDFCLLTERGQDAWMKNELLPGFSSSSVECGVQKSFANSLVKHPSSMLFRHKSHKSNQRRLSDTISDFHPIQRSTSQFSAYSEQSDVHAEVEQVRLELRKVVKLYNRACEDLVHAQAKVHVLSSDCLEVSNIVNASKKSEEKLRIMAVDEKERHLEAVKEIEMARNLLSKEIYERQIAEVKGIQECMEKQRIIDALFLGDGRYKRYSRDQIEVATDFFSETKVVGVGSYGKVYKCKLDHTPVAIKVLSPDASDRKDEFLREIEVLSQLRHPHIVLLLGACPEIGCLVYEYMENGSLDDHIFSRNSNQSLPWVIRFRMVFEVACGLSFLHNSKPEPIIHRDLKPGNILLDRNFVSKIGDVGLAKLITDVVPDNVTEYGNSVLVGTLCYMDPEYQRTGTVRPKSDLYGFGIIILQLLTAQHPNGLIPRVENAFESGSFSDVLDKSITNWPLAETKKLAQVALKCSTLRCRDRPDLDTEVLPVLKKLADFADASKKVNETISAPGHFYCPILQEVMKDPHIASDGYTYEHKAIQIWVDRYNVSPVTNQRLQHKMLTPNHTLHTAIQAWRSHVISSRT
ncbi:U-box domain-containing protein 34-like [Heracleum sosnowskyi]|uniref:RING-type E3 ubiquitin transferase n=1 Tax=Heracleum sosnowskyi TaxID=360622 RepID=A0AAD8HEW5_9APIA|nr:U-box domain-containing protein 34-like [Heracleum sosnowskyi]